MATQSNESTVTVRTCPYHTWLAGLGLSLAASVVFPGWLPAPLKPDTNIFTRLFLAPPLVLTALYFNVHGQRHLKLAGGGPEFNKPVLKLVTSGPFQYTRNPLYAAGACTSCALSLLLNSWWPLLVLVPWLAHVELVVIPREEALLSSLFPEEWKRYSDTVPRWFVCLHHRFWH